MSARKAIESMQRSDHWSSTYLFRLWQVMSTDSSGHFKHESLWFIIQYSTEATSKTGMIYNHIALTNVYCLTLANLTYHCNPHTCISYKHLNNAIINTSILEWQVGHLIGQQLQLWSKGSTIWNLLSLIVWPMIWYKIMKFTTHYFILLIIIFYVKL